ncbi:MAG: RNA polymerase sigma factor [Candidatus Aminicenantes bacterium]|nr:RNA polymerase sigma factor [Candidatus Aminicenantes bacterium]
MDTGDLVRLTKAGDRQAFVELTRRYQKKVFVLTYSFFRNTEDALDLVQETFLRLYERLDSFEEGRNFEAWLLQVAKNLCIDQYRRFRSRGRSQAADARVEDLPIPDERAGQGERSTEVRQALARCLDQLADRQRTIFLMRHVSEMGNDEIARVLNISTGTVKSLHFKAIRNLRALMAPYGECS